MRQKNLGMNNLYGTSNFTFTLSDNDFLIIIDMNLENGASVTNDINNVISSIAHTGIDLYNKKVIYRDSTGTYDAILINQDGTLRAFASLNAKEPTAAQKIYDDRIEHQILLQHSSFRPC